MQIRDLITELSTFDGTCKVEVEGGHEVAAIKHGQRSAVLMIHDELANKEELLDAEDELKAAEQQLAKIADALDALKDEVVAETLTNQQIVDRIEELIP